MATQVGQMHVYTLLYESMLDYCDRAGFRLGLVYTVAMLALGLGLCLNLLSIVDLLWTARVLHSPYYRAGGLHPEHYVYALLYSGFVANTILARIKFNTDYRCLSQMPEIQTRAIPAREAPSIRMPGPAYVLGSAAFFVATLILGLMTNS
jgi:hypothetical protein